MGPCIVETESDRIVIRDVQYKFKVIQCRNEEDHVNNLNKKYLLKKIYGVYFGWIL